MVRVPKVEFSIQTNDFDLRFLACLYHLSSLYSPHPLHIHNDEHNISGMVTAWCLAESAEPSITHRAPPDDL